jgi:hypothetical protein
MKRIVLLVIHALEGIGALLGGILLVATPDGSSMQLPLTVLHGVFPNFLIPGLALTMLGLLNIVAFFAVLRDSKIAWILSGMALIGLAIWFVVEIAVIRELHWLQFVMGVPVFVGIWAIFPLIPLPRRQ